MKILITTGIFEPEPGGPAIYTARLADKLVLAGHQVSVITYSDKNRYDFDKNYTYPVKRIKRSNKLLNYFKYFFAVLKNLKKCDLVYSLDYSSAGLPVYLATRIIRKKYIIRIGGDFIWEKYINTGNKPITLEQFYNDKIFLQYKRFFNLSKRVVQGAVKIIFNSDPLRELFAKYYSLDANKLETIYNPIPVFENIPKRESINKEIVYFGRLIKVKNIKSALIAFAEYNKDFTFTIIGKGPEKNSLIDLVKKLDIAGRVNFISEMRQDELLKKIVNSYYFILPSWTDISPNQVYECLSIGLPVLMTKENFLPINTSNWIKIDPSSLDDIKNKMKSLTDPKFYEDFSKRNVIDDFDFNWDDVLAMHLSIFTLLNNFKSN